MTKRPAGTERTAVFLGVLLALAGTTLFATGLGGLDTAFSSTSDGAASATPALLGLAVLGAGVGLATLTRFGRPGALAALGVPLLVAGIGIVAFGGATTDTVHAVALTSSEASDNAAAAAGIPIAVGILIGMVGLTLLFIFGTRARTTRRR